MKYLAFLPMTVLLLSMACSNDTDPATAPVDYLGAINQGKNKAIVDAALLQVNNALGQYQATNFKPAPSLQQLIDDALLTTLPKFRMGLNGNTIPKPARQESCPNKKPPRLCYLPCEYSSQ